MKFVEIYGVEKCSYCKLAVKWCEDNDVEFNYIDITNNSELLEELNDRIGFVKTVPQIFVDGDHVGGYTELVGAA